MCLEDLKVKCLALCLNPFFFVSRSRIVAMAIVYCCISWILFSVACGYNYVCKWESSSKEIECLSIFALICRGSFVFIAITNATFNLNFAV